MRENWIETKIADVADIISGKNQSKVIDVDGPYPIYGSGGIMGYANDYLCKEGTTIIGRKGTINSPIYVKSKFWNVDTAFGFSAKGILKKRLLYFFCVRFNFKKLDKSTTIPSLAKRDLLNIDFPLAPLPEQRAIVDKIEQLFIELDNGIRSFKTAQEQLKTYRQAVLKKAFDGELTKEWRSKQKNLPSAEKLLQQIKEEREKHYQQQLTDWKQAVKDWETNGKVGKPSKLKEYPVLNEAELKEFSSIPDTSNWIYFGNLYRETPQNGIYKPSTLYGSGTDIIRIDNFYSGKLLSSQGFKKVRLSQVEIEKYKVENDQILINRVNSIEYLGKSGLIKKLSVPTVFESNIMKITLMNSLCSSQYIVHYLTSVLGIREIRKNAKHAVNQASINQTDVSLTAVPICSFKEQHQIVQEIESRLSVCDKLEESIKESLLKAEALRQSILKQAFEGKLLSEEELAATKKEADWEPAEVLLRRIEKEKNLVAKKKK